MDWISMNYFNKEKLNKTEISLHQTAQFVAMFGNSYLPKAVDDSQSNLLWEPESQTIQGRTTELPAVTMSLDVVGFQLKVISEKEESWIPLQNQSKTDLLESVRAKLHETGLDSKKYQFISHFTLPDHELDRSAPFIKPEEEFLKLWSGLRSIAQRKLEKIGSGYQFASEVRIWPHHFDTGLYIPLEKDAQGNDLKSIGLGLAMADGTVSEHYFYINHWSKEPVQYNELPPIKRPGFWVKEGWTGLVLPVGMLSAMSQKRDGEEILDTFFDEGIKATKSLI